MPGQRVSQFAGGVIGLVGGAAAAIFTVGATAGFLWLFVFGDNPWPQWASWILTAVFAVVLVAGVALGWLVGSRMRVWTALLLASLAVAGAASTVIAKVTRERAARTQETNEKAAIARLAQESHKISDLRAVPRTDNSGWDIVVQFSGARRGQYRLMLDLHRGGAGLLSRESEIALPAADHELAFPLDLKEVIAGYEGKVFTRGARNVAIDETVDLECALQPLLTAKETAGLGSNDLQNLRLGYSPLLSRKKTALNVKFVVR